MLKVGELSVGALTLRSLSTAALLASVGLTACGSAAAPDPTVRTVAPLHVAQTTAAKATQRTPAHKTPRRKRAAHGKLGQLIVGRFDGDTPPAAFLQRVRSGELGGVILFTENDTASSAGVRQVVDTLQAAAASGHNPPLLIMSDQEGGDVKRFSWAPPSIAPAAMSSDALARSEGEATGTALRSVGVNVDLAPVADVERVSGSFLGSRSFGSDPQTAGARACAFADGLEAAGVGFALKHFPGLGRATASTDQQPVTIDATATALRTDYVPYRRCGGSRDGIVMVSSAIYPTLTGSQLPAVMSPEIYREELPYASGTQPVTISDDLQAGALRTESYPARAALEAGLDLLLYAQTEAGSADAYALLDGELRAGTIDRDTLDRAERAVAALKELVAGGTDGPAGEVGYGSEIPSAPETVAPETASGR